ncbi:MAG: hypothetical protein AN485_22815, partial [Anabaena sp. MDT14b]
KKYSAGDSTQLEPRYTQPRWAGQREDGRPGPTVTSVRLPYKLLPYHNPLMDMASPHTLTYNLMVLVLAPSLHHPLPGHEIEYRYVRYPTLTGSVAV